MNRSASHILIAANPKSGRSGSASQVRALEQGLIEQGFLCETLHDLDAFRDRSLQLHAQDQLRAVVSAGGDGTVAALANMLPASIPIQLFPLGTENLLAKHFGITADIPLTVRALAAAKPLKIDAGSANGKLFLVMASCGYDAEVVRCMHAIRRGHINRWSYAGPIWSALRKYSFPEMPFRLEDQTLPRVPPTDSPPATKTQASCRENQAAWLFVFNVPKYAANLEFCPQANPTDGRLDVCTFRRPGIPHGLAYLTRLYLRNHDRMRGFSHQLCTGLHLDAPTDRHGQPLADIPYQLDGDPGGVLPLNIEVLPERLTLILPT